jgi:hypothetical protein
MAKAFLPASVAILQFRDMLLGEILSQEKHTPGRSTLLGQTRSWEKHSPGRHTLLGETQSSENTLPGDRISQEICCPINIDILRFSSVPPFRACSPRLETSSTAASSSRRGCRLHCVVGVAWATAQLCFFITVAVRCRVVKPLA